MRQFSRKFLKLKLSTCAYLIFLIFYANKRSWYIFARHFSTFLQFLFPFDFQPSSKHSSFTCHTLANIVLRVVMLSVFFVVSAIFIFICSHLHASSFHDYIFFVKSETHSSVIQPDTMWKCEFWCDGISSQITFCEIANFSHHHKSLNNWNVAPSETSFQLFSPFSFNIFRGILSTLADVECWQWRR